MDKTAYWKKWAFFELFEDLDIAYKLLEESAAGRKFLSDFEDEIDDLDHANWVDLSMVWEWFHPGHEWDSIMGKKGRELGERIFKRANNWMQNSGNG